MAGSDYFLNFACATKNCKYLNYFTKFSKFGEELTFLHEDVEDILTS